MLHTVLAEALTTHLNDNKAKWTDQDLTVKTELDPQAVTTTDFGVYIVPHFIEYMIDSNQNRGQDFPLTRTYYCSLLLHIRFSELPADGTEGVANWSEVKTFIDTWQRAQEVLTEYSLPGMTLVNADSDPPMELEQDYRNFVVMTVLGYQATKCPSEYNLSEGASVLDIQQSSQPTSSHSIRNTVLEGIKDSIRQRR
jgi:hypothetical protein